ILARVLRRTQSSLQEITVILNTFCIVIIVVALFPLASTAHISDSDIKVDASPYEQVGPSIHEWLSANFEKSGKNELPDVYFVILDAYARGDVLKSRFNFDNSDFLDWLKTQGFFVGHKSHSNYAWTHLSLASTLNAEYLDTLVPEEWRSQAPEKPRSRYQYIQSLMKPNFIITSRVQRFFSSLGYQIVYNGTTVSEVHPNTMAQAVFGSVNHFELLLLNPTIAQPLISMFRNQDIQNLQISKFDRVLGKLDSLAPASNKASPKFVFHHVMSPHAPFCFDANGEMVPPHPIYDFSQWLDDASAQPGYKDWYRENYSSNVAGLNHYLKATLQRLLESTGRDAIIIVQSDHGPIEGFDLKSTINTDVVERFGILNAIFMPAGISRDGLEQTTSAVNTFRVVLSNTFNLDLPPLQDRAFYSTGDLSFEEITNRLDE
ncbi:sulfatase-like hydrolase/transferase, partial [Pseudomonadota bacterium]